MKSYSPRLHQMGLSTTVSIPLIGRHWECYSNMPTYMILPSLLNCLSSFPWLICFAAIRKNTLILGFLFTQYDSLPWKSLGFSFILFSRLLCFLQKKKYFIAHVANWVSVIDHPIWFRITRFQMGEPGIPITWRKGGAGEGRMCRQKCRTLLFPEIMYR